MFQITLTNLEETSGTWGEFIVHKEFTVHNVKNKNSIRGVNGFIIQIITKQTNANILCSETTANKPKSTIKSIEDISKFTNNNVKYMNDSYIELFPILNGECEYGDNFQNGGILRYYKSKNQYYTNDNPPTFGYIEQIGTIFFISFEDKEHVATVLNTIGKHTRTIHKAINILGLEWNISNHTPANGLPYIPYNSSVIEYLLSMKQSNMIRHKVSASWNGLLDEEIRNINQMNIQPLNLIKNCKPLAYNSTEISEARAERAKTKISSLIET